MKGKSLQAINSDSFSMGVLIFKVVQGKLLRNTEFFGQMDPFLQVEINGKTYKTTTIKEGGKNPVWNETFK